MAFFQNSVVSKYSKALNKEVLSKAFTKYKAHFHNPEIQENIRNSKEEQYQGEFLIDLFVNILGYTKNPTPNFNLTTEYKNIKDSKKADGAIVINDVVKAVIELKGTDTVDLGRIETQAFGYKNNQVDCDYIITSNFEKLRFYIGNAIDHLEFNLFTLSEKDFELLYLCLAYENIDKDIPKKIKAESVSQENNITQKLYGDYSLFKRELHRNLVELNPQHPPLELFKKSQKLLDRFLFLYFAEDRQLLPPNSVRLILDDWKELQERDAHVPLYDRFRKYFEYLNTGYKGKRYDVFAYNGGLFKPDEILDGLKINDELLHKHALKLSEYNFESEVDVNILGHIFENSLNELDEIQAQLEGKEIDKAKTKRKKDGVFYTPKYITKYIVDNTIGKLCIDKKEELNIVEEEFTADKKRPKKTTQVLAEKLSGYKDWLLKLTICDPACGSGAFLNQALDFLITEHKYIDELQARLFGDALVLSNIEKSILENNLFGVDLNEESVEIAKLSLWLRTAQPNRKLNDLNNNIKCGNSLIDDPKVAGDKAFNWQEQFPQVFANGGFDVVIGNPPYVRQELLGDYKEYFSKNYKVFNFSSDLFAYFYEKAFVILKANGVFSFISNTFEKTTAGVDLRKYLKENVKFVKLIDFTQIQIFEGATTYPIILVAQKSSIGLSENLLIYSKISGSANPQALDIDLFSKSLVVQSSLDDFNWTFKTDKENSVLAKVQKHKTLREKFGKCYRGLITGLNEAFISNDKFESSEHIKKIIEGKEIDKWSTLPATQKLILFKSKWTKNRYGADVSEEKAILNIKSEFPSYFEKLLPFEEQAKKRFDKGDFWWEMRNCAYYDLFEKSKIIFPNLQNKNKFCFDELATYVNAPAVFLPTESRALLSILNSKLVWYFLTSICVVRNGGYIEVKPQYFEQIPIPDINVSSETSLSEKAKANINFTRELQVLSQKFQGSMERKFQLKELSSKLQSWYSLSYGEFIKELAKKKVKLSLSDEAEWESYFLQESKKANELKAEIEKTDKEIDRMVYELFELTEEEIRIVEGN